ncbi:MAG: S-methyl-5-thioribose-1-phosphate isomerase [Burkholderiales bacterium]|nr:S-methyl-5-thioribose-1-phosphate isomerase [Burkholderiales bacterium]
MRQVEALRWTSAPAPVLELIDQRVLPRRMVYRRYTAQSGAAGVARAIASMVVRGAPAIGVAAAYGMALEAARRRASSAQVARLALERAAVILAASRPTAVNLTWALARCRAAIARERGDARALAATLESLALRMHAEDIAINRAIGRHGARLLPRGVRILTHCNAGALATAGYGTALGVIRAARARIAQVWVDETRPFLQGARLTAWELVQEGIPATLITDNMAAHFMQRGQVDAVIVGCDRVAANGDVANKIGTYNLAVLARAHRLPFYVACPLSTIDPATAHGDAIPIEERAAAEVTGHAGRTWAPREIAVANPAFDVTPARMVSALITERGVVERPGKSRIAALLSG